MLPLIAITILLESIAFQPPLSSSSPQEWMSRRPNTSLARMESTSPNGEKLTASTMEHSGVRVSREKEKIFAEYLLAAVMAAAAAR